MEAEEVKKVVTESFNALSFVETAAVIKAIEDDFYTSEKMSMAEFIEYETRWYKGFCDTTDHHREGKGIYHTADQLRSRVQKDLKYVIETYND